jgi:hypothetical protein
MQAAIMDVFVQVGPSTRSFLAVLKDNGRTHLKINGGGYRIELTDDFYYTVNTLSTVDGVYSTLLFEEQGGTAFGTDRASVTTHHLSIIMHTIIQ